MCTRIFRGLMTAMVTLIFGASLMMISSEPLHADVKIEKTRSAHFSIKISNTITKKDADDIAQRVGDFDDADIWVYLNSSGGDVDAAMQIGRIIRKYGATVQVGKMECYSSCALIYIAGTTRLSSGKIGLHRPYFASAPQNPREIERQVPIMLQKLKSYVQEMGVTDNSYQEMVNTQPTKMKLYLDAEIQRIVPMNDPIDDEIITSYEAVLYGVSTAEIRRRSFEMQRCSAQLPHGWMPGEGPEYVCATAIMWGLSESVFTRREKEAEETCKYSDEEKAKLDLLPGRKTRDHPVKQKHEACIRNIMLGR